MATYSSVHSNISSNIAKIDNKIDNYINIKNAVKLLDNYSNWEGYIKLYTEVQSNFDVDDIVYITYTDYPISVGVFNLENPDTPYSEWSMGYKVLAVNKLKNEVVINREYNDIKSGALLSDQFLSKVSVRGGTFTGGVIDGLVFYNSDIYSGATFTQGIFKWCNISDITFDDKYIDTKVLYTTNTFSSKFTRKKSNIATVYKSRRYWYNTIDNCTLYNCSIKNGKFDNSTLLGVSGVSYITDGEFYNCTISGYTINGGTFRDCIIEANCNWNYGIWYNSNGTNDFRASWTDGVWNSGSFISKTWSGGTFNAGVFSAATWVNGTVNLGNFYYANWLNGLVRNGNFYNSTWTTGTFNSGSFVDSTWNNGYFNNGTFLGSTFNDGNVQGGLFTGSTITDGSIYKGEINDVVIEGGNFYGSFNIKDSEISNVTIRQGTVENSTITSGDLYNGFYSDVTFMGSDITIYNGKYKDCYLEDLTVKNGNFEKCTAYNVPFYNGIFTEGWYENGIWYNGIWNGVDNVGTFKGNVFLDGDFYGGYFSGDTATANPLGWSAEWSGGTFHYGYWKGVYRTSLPIYPYPKQNYSQQTNTNLQT